MTVRRTPMLIAIAGLAALAVCVGPAQSAFPGENGKIAFVSDLWGPLDIYSINPDGTDQSRLTTNALASGIGDGEPAWSPDGRKIAFARGPGFIDSTYANVFVMNADGSAQTNLTDDLTSFNTDPAWSPAGDAIAFVSDRVNSTADIFRMNADGTGQVNLTNTPDVREMNPSWSPDESRIAYGDGGGVWVMNANGSDRTNLTGPNFWSDGQPSWSPTGDRIAFTSDRDDVGSGEIYLMNADGSAATRLTTHPEYDGFPQWSPDGTRIVFQSLRGGQPFGLYVLDPANLANPPQRLGTQAGGAATYPDWQPLPGSDNTTPGTNVSVTPADLTTGDSPVTITFDQVTAAGVTTLVTSSSGPPPPHDFEVDRVYYNLSTTAQFSGQAEVCFEIVQPNAPRIAHWVGIPRVFTTPTTYYKDVAGPSGVIVEAGQGNYACASVTSFSPFALLEPVAVRGTLFVITNVVNDDGGVLGPTDFTMSVAGGNPIPASGPGAAAPGTSVTLDPGAYTVSASYTAGSKRPYDISLSADCSGTIDAGEPKTCTITGDDRPQDAVPPEIVCGAADGEWHDANVSIDCTASDPGSGLANASDAAFSLSTSVADGTENGDAATESRQVCDLAGNCAPAGPIGGNKIDRKAPALTLPANPTVNATSPAGALVSFSASASDGADPSAAASCSPASGSTFAIGTNSVLCTATDHVGNSSTGPFSVTVLGAKEQLSQLIARVVNASALPPALKTKLIGKLQSLTASFDPSNAKQKQAVCVALNVFKGVVQALSGRGIPPAQAAEWIADANRIRAVLGC